MKLAEARRVAQELVNAMTPYCARIQIAGSIRREMPEVKDVEIVAIPKWAPHPDPDLLRGLGLAGLRVNLLHEWAIRNSGIRWIKSATPEIMDWPPKPEGKYWRGLLASGIKLDLFLCEPDNWGTILLIRSGSADFSEAVATHGKRIGKRFHDGHLSVLKALGRTIIPMPEEQDVFDEMGLAWVEPRARTGRWALRMKPMVGSER